MKFPCEIVNHIFVYRSPSQDNIEFGNVVSDFDELSSKTFSSDPLFIIIQGDFNGRSSSL